ncbi:MAG: prepilin-type N-terminal cleavage/methylation domain-containing protein [Halioglobus sp.]
MDRDKASKGFTLIEVVVSLAILSLVLLGTVTGLRTLGNTQVSLERVTQRADEIRTVSAFVRDLMESAVVGSGSGGLTLGGGSSAASYFRSGTGFLEWKTNLLFGEAYGGTYVVRISQEGDQLVLKWLESEATSADASKWEGAPSRSLVESLNEFTIHMRPDYDKDWISDWRETSIAPALVRLQIKASDRYWPDLIMRVQK